ncbi:596_t:CDS:2, partial [Entrophospora sp. SA101]
EEFNVNINNINEIITKNNEIKETLINNIKALINKINDSDTRKAQAALGDITNHEMIILEGKKQNRSMDVKKEESENCMITTNSKTIMSVQDKEEHLSFISQEEELSFIPPTIEFSSFASTSKSTTSATNKAPKKVLPWKEFFEEIFIAANFYNNEDILYDFNEELLKLIQILKPENVYVSIFENGSKDKTKSLLYTLQSSLNLLGVANTIITDDNSKRYDRRITYMANLRNEIIYFNDILWSVSDILTLLETNNYNYDAVCAMDYYWTFHNTFATRELPLRFSYSSEPSSLNVSDSYPWPPTSYYPYFYNPTVQQQIYNGEPVQVFSCWNGVVVMNAEPFVKHNVRFRALMPLLEEGLPFEASECCLVYSDFRKLGYNKIFINPNVRVSYKYRFYIWSNYILPIINKLFFQYLNHPTPPSIFSDEGLKMQDIMVNVAKYNISELDKICLQ